MWVFGGEGGFLTDFCFIQKFFHPQKKGSRKKHPPVEATGASTATGSAPSATDTSQRFARLAGDSATDTGGGTWWKGGRGFRLLARRALLIKGNHPFPDLSHLISPPPFFTYTSLLTDIYTSLEKNPRTQTTLVLRCFKIEKVFV